MKKLFDQNKIDLFWQFVVTSFKLRYQNSALGFLWVLIKPYSTFLVMYFIWQKISRQDLDNYALFLLLGVVLYTFFNELVVGGQNSLLERSHVILKVNFPRQIAIISALTNALINLLINLVFVGIIIVLTSNIAPDLVGILYFAFVVLTLFIFTTGLAFFTSILTIRFRDLQDIFELGLFLLFWATPIFYALEGGFVGGTVGKLISINPLGIVINQARAGLDIYGEIDFPIILLFFVVSLLFSAIGWVYFSKNVKKIAEYY